jgi:hypothetical protein
LIAEYNITQPHTISDITVIKPKIIKISSEKLVKIIKLKIIAVKKEPGNMEGMSGTKKVMRHKIPPMSGTA